ncbi:MAG: hypothetical protein SPL30_02140 [Succinivibrio sp.]|nr:hypothetical protein [Succinivibrio sp.]
MAVAVFKIRISHRAQADLLEFSPASQKKAAVLVGLLKQDLFASHAKSSAAILPGRTAEGSISKITSSTRSSLLKVK